ncbi:hypothetical protein MMC25_008045 [Agyrium rufum]|nr:hypothetical protein [Agyrium rufum]
MEGKHPPLPLLAHSGAIAITPRPMSHLSTTEADEATVDMDEPPDYYLRLPQTSKVDVETASPNDGYFKIPTSSAPCKGSLLTQALHTTRHTSFSMKSPFSPDHRAPSTASAYSTCSATSAAELTSDGELTSPTRTTTPSPPNTVNYAPVQGNGAMPAVATTEKVPSKTTPQTVESAPARKTCITFACGRKEEKGLVPTNDYKIYQVSPEVAVIPPKRPCMLRFACPNKLNQGERNNEVRPRTDDPIKPDPHSYATHQNNNEPEEKVETITKSERTSTGASAKPKKYRPEALRFHEFASAYEEEDEWLQQEPSLRKKITVNDTLRKELVIRQLGEEAEEEAEVEDAVENEDVLDENDDDYEEGEADGDEVDEDLDEDQNEEDDKEAKIKVSESTGPEGQSSNLRLGEVSSVSRNHTTNGRCTFAAAGPQSQIHVSTNVAYDPQAGSGDDGNESDDEGGFADSDDESEPGSEYHFWSAGLTTAATSTDGLDFIRPRQRRSESLSSSDSTANVHEFTLRKPISAPRKRRSPARRSRMRPGTPDLPDSTDFVCGTLDEDRPMEAAYLSCLEQRRRAKKPFVPQDVDPSFPVSDPEDDNVGDRNDTFNGSDIFDNEHLMFTGQAERNHKDRSRERKRSSIIDSRGVAKSPSPKPVQRLRSPPPRKRMTSPPPKLRTKVSSPPPGRFFGNMLQRPRSPPPPRRLPKSPAVSRRTSVSPSSRKPLALQRPQLAQRPTLTHTKSLPRTPNPFWHLQRDNNLTSHGFGSGNTTAYSSPHQRGPIDIVAGLQAKRQRRREKFWRQHCRKEGKKTKPGEGAMRMKMVGLEVAERNRGYGPKPIAMLSL